MSKKRVVVVGAGPGGLTSAMILAHRGFDVTVFEARDVVGGRNAPLKADGYTFDTGPTFLMMNFILREMFEEAGRDVEDYLRFKKLDPMYRLAFADRDYVVVSADHAKMREQIRRRFPATKAAWTGSSRKSGSATRTSFPAFKLSFTFQAKYLGMSAWECPALFTMPPFVEHEYGIFHGIGDVARKVRLVYYPSWLATVTRG